MTSDPYGLFNPDRPTKILLMRHPQTMGNISERYQGQSDSPLTELGEGQARRAAAGLVAWQPDTIVSSPLGRCLAIAEPAAEALGLAVETDDRLMEMAFGALEGLTHDEVVAQGLPYYWGPESDRWPAEGAESLEAFTERVVDVADWLAQRQGYTAVITHGGVIRTIISYWLQIPSFHVRVLTVRNVESACFAIDERGLLYVEGLGLLPEWLGDLG